MDVLAEVKFPILLGTCWPPAMLAVAESTAAATLLLSCGVMTCWNVPPTALTGPANPPGAWEIGLPASIHAICPPNTRNTCSTTSASGT